MKKRNPLWLMMAVVFAISLCACAPMQPNSSVVPNEEGPAPASSTANQAVEEDSGTVLKTDFGGGIVAYQIQSIELADSYEAAGIDPSKIAGQQKLQEGEKFLTITFSLENESMDPASLGGDYLVNNFYLATQETVDAHRDGPMFNSAIYFDKAINDDRRYFTLELPPIGQSTEITLGWALPSSDLQALEGNQLNLVYSTMGWDGALLLPLKYEGAGAEA